MEPTKTLKTKTGQDGHTYYFDKCEEKNKILYAVSKDEVLIKVSRDFSKIDTFFNQILGSSDNE